jgi:hypothetical protein
MMTHGQGMHSGNMGGSTQASGSNPRGYSPSKQKWKQQGIPGMNSMQQYPSSSQG